MTRFSRLSLVICAIFFAGAVFAAPGISVKTSKGFFTNLEIKVPDLEMKNVDVLGRSAVSLSLPGGSISFEKDAPELPRLTAMIMTDPMRVPVLNVKRIKSEIINLETPVVPSKGNLTRNVDPNTVSYKFGEVYSQDKWYPSDENLVKIDSPFVMRDLRGVRLLVSPVQYNPVKNQIRIHRLLEVSIGGGAVDSKNVIKGPISIGKVFEPMYRNIFVNFDGASSRLPRLDENGRLLVFCPEEFLEAIKPLLAWKTKCGIEVTTNVLKKNSRITAAQVKAAVQEEYDKGGLTHIILVGDSAQIPTLKGVRENADSDPCFTKLAGDDHVPDCLISRISAEKPEQVAYQVAKFINYEQFPTIDDTAWYKKGSGIASNEGNPTDAVRAGWLKDALKKFEFAVDEIYDPKATKAMVFDAVNQGRTLINYIGHGSTTSWGTTYFNNTDCGKLKNGWKLPLIWSVACVNGSFVGKECFCEAWMKAGDIEDPKGAVAIFGASTNQEWVPPCDVQNEIITNYTVNELYKTAGGLAFNGIMKGLEIYGTEPKGSGVMMFEQWHLFGDATLLVRFKTPSTITAKADVVNSGAESKVTVKVVDADGKPVSNARVTVYTERFEVKSSSVTNDKGIAKISAKAEKNANGYLTVVGTNLVPVVDQKFTF